MPNDFQEYVALFSNICTILAFILALILFIKWKRQHDYSFIRDHLFDLEKSFFEAHVLHLTVMVKYCSFRIFELQNENSSKIEIEEKKYQESYDQFKNKYWSYQTNYNLLLNMDRNSEFFINPLRLSLINSDLDYKFNEFKLSVDNKTDIDDLKEYLSDEVEKLRKSAVEILVYMGDIRKDL
ncbi:hypothetical protein [Acinetobacter sp. PK01]|uniref:hypothetical protein n=1 Tax=Acinetobacter sp. PK01 TaxID=2930198 RepID=UPI001FB7FA6E|nr:hypothetical protein [Acinetobacter sp. PK01]UOG18706.1 hypothetical protein MP622_03580 [Acinetobacter sp. PK01]